MFAPSRGQLNGLYASRVSPPKRETLAHAVVARGVPQSLQIVDINDFHCAYAHIHEDLLRITTKQLGVQLRGELLPCQGCSEGKGLRKRVKPFTNNRADKPAGRLFVDLTGLKPVPSRGGKEYMLMVRDKFSRFTRVCFLHSKDEAAEYFSKYLAEFAPRKAEVVRSDVGGEFHEGGIWIPMSEREDPTGIHNE